MSVLLYAMGCAEGRGTSTLCWKRVRRLTMKQEQAEHMLSHSSMRPARHRCSSKSQKAPVTRSSSARKPNFDDNPEVAPRPETLRYKTYRRPSAQTRPPVDDDEAPYTSSPRVRTVRRRPANHPEAAPKPRKRGIGDEDGLGFLNMYRTKPAKRRKMATPVYQRCFAYYATLTYRRMNGRCNGCSRNFSDFAVSPAFRPHRVVNSSNSLARLKVPLSPRLLYEAPFRNNRCKVRGMSGEGARRENYSSTLPG